MTNSTHGGVAGSVGRAAASVSSESGAAGRRSRREDHVDRGLASHGAVDDDRAAVAGAVLTICNQPPSEPRRGLLRCPLQVVVDRRS